MHKNILKIFFKNSFLFLGGLIFFKIVDFFARVLIGRFWGPRELGNFSLFVYLLFVLAAFSLFGFDKGLKKYIAISWKNNRKKASQLLTSAIIFVVPISILISLFLVFFYYTDISRNLKDILLFLAILLPVYSLVQLLAASLEATNTVKYTLIIEKLLRPTLFIIGLGFLILGRIDFSKVYLWFFVSYFLVLLVFWHQVKQRIGIFPSASEITVNTRKILVYSWPLGIHNLVYILISGFGLFFAKIFFSSELAGIYASAYEIARLSPFLLASITPLYFTINAQIYANLSVIALRHFYKTVSNVIFALSIPFVFVAFNYSDQILSFIFGANFVLAGPILKILLLGYLVDILVGPVDLFLSSSKHPKLVLFNSCFSLLFGLVALLFIKNYGLLGLAMASSLAIAVQNILGALEIYYLYKINTLSFFKFIILIIFFGWSLF